MLANLLRNAHVLSCWTTMASDDEAIKIATHSSSFVTTLADEAQKLNSDPVSECCYVTSLSFTCDSLERPSMAVSLSMAPLVSSLC